MSQADIKALHDAARIYCKENCIKWRCFYSENFDDDGNRTGETTLESEQVYPRYLVLSAMLKAIELYVPEDFDTLEEARNKVIQAAQEANDEMTCPPNTGVEKQTMDEERQKFSRYIDTLGPQEFGVFPRQPYQRTLTPKEANDLFDAFDEKWGGFSYPFDGVSVFCAQARWFDEEVSFSTLADILRTRGIFRVSQFNSRWPCEIDVDLIGDSEAYWSSGEMNWFVNHGSEGDITFGGEWLVSEIKSVWPTWEKRTYSGWDYPYPGESENT